MQFIRFNQLEIQSSLEYWTAERMANAIPAPLLHIDMPEIRQKKDNEFSNAESEMFLSCFPTNRTNSINAVKVSVRKDPYRKAGRLYYRQGYSHRKGYSRDFYCTAQFVGFSNILLTAAHCLRNPDTTMEYDGWSHSMVFNRAYHNGSVAQEMNIVNVGIENTALPDDWGTGGENCIKNNYGFVKTVSPSSVGYLELSKKTYFQLPSKLKAIGYPKNYGGYQQFMYKQYGRRGIFEDDQIIMIGNRLGEGSAGGAWFASRGSNAVVGINAFKKPDSKFVWGPAFGPETRNLMMELNA